MELFGKHYQAPGTMPGMLSKVESDDYTLTLVDYRADYHAELHGPSPGECQAFAMNDNNTWLHIQGSPSSDALRAIADAFKLHRLHVEDILNSGQRPKLDVIDQQAFVILSLPVFNQEQVSVSQVGIFLGERFVISISAGDQNPFTMIYERLHKSSGKLRTRDVDYLFYALIDTVIDYGFPLLEVYAERIEGIEEQLVEHPNANLVHQIHGLRRELLLLHRRLWPHREVISELQRYDDDSVVQERTLIYLRDCYDHTIAILEMLETYREMTASMLEVYLSSVSHRLNEVMRVLTVIATLFIPPTFVVGLYGMNFDRHASGYNMPELGWPYGYLFVWGIIITMVLGMLLYFRRKRWF